MFILLTNFYQFDVATTSKNDFFEKKFLRKFEIYIIKFLQ